ncbi:hypothetical protein SSX86_013542 [Deinandra increscens subsp. villosa]|uniref:Uncharacterized protein n=1 Tax=Deinandra increscens subsp. villosa TaxID=3103831 RepID=A0AAP0D067_9ASTR
MENFNRGFDSSKGAFYIHSPVYFTIHLISNNENELNPEMTSKILKSPGKNQLPPKNFMSPTISATIKASVPRKKILGERNETLDALEQPSLQRSISFGSKSVKSPVFDSVDDDVVAKPCLPPYDPVKNYLSPRPKFLRYNPNRRRKISNLQENDEDGVKISTYFDEGMPSSDLQLGLGSSVTSLDSCSHQESAEEDENVNVEEDEDANGEDDDEEEMVEFGEEDRCCSLKGLFKFLFVVIAVILTTQAICLVNSPSHSQTLESVWGVNHLHNHVYGLNFSEVANGPIGEQDLLVGRLQGNAKTDDYVHQDELQNDDSNVIQDELSQEHESDYVEAEMVHDINQDGFTEEDEQLTNEVGFETANDMEDGVEEEVNGVEAATVLDFNQDALTEEDDSYDDVRFETANDMEDGVEEEEVDDVKPTEMLTKFTSFDTTIAVVIGSLLILTSFCVIYFSKSKKSPAASVTTPVVKEESEDLEPSTNPEPMIQQKEELLTPPLENDISKVHIPSVHLLGEVVFGEELTSSSKISAENHSSNSSIIQTTAGSFSQTKSSYMEMSSGDSQTVKKKTRKNAGVVTPSPVRRSSRLKTRSIMSP